MPIDEIVPGVDYAYAVGEDAQVVRVRCDGLLTGQRPMRVLITFMDKSDGRSEETPPVRLKTPWSGRQEYIDYQASWKAVRAASLNAEDPREDAGRFVFDQWIEGTVAGLGYGRDAGALYVHDCEALAEQCGTDPRLIDSAPLVFSCWEGLIAPWPVAETVLRGFCEKNFQKVLRAVDDLEFAELQRAVDSGAEASDRHDDMVRVTVTAGIVREWCGAGIAERRDHEMVLMDVARRRGDALRQAVVTLSDAGFKDQAERISRDLEEM
ncbi:hypothetical protein [Speluncibacter jeojiensis]|uniref:Uncharacterized protein n=1 Tax=Speluncibacter jeojiensis TaxID=2710754 RepID=A0A9X4M496_9ACTN|nr:hypothetical protein [Corynebacteriales bacterium D3-21]